MKTIGAILRDRLYLSLVGVLAVLAVTVAYLFTAVLDIPLFGGTRVVKVEMASTGGLFEGSAVTYRGVKIGKVRTIGLTRDGIVATVAITADEDIPVDSVAKVRSLSPVGEQYLDFQPNSTKGPYLEDGDVVPATATDIPKTLASTVIAVNKVLDQVDAEKLHVLLSELSTGLAGTGKDIGRLVDQGQVLLADLDRVWPQTERLLVNGDTALDIVPDKEDDFRRLATSARQFAAFLADYDPQLRQTLTDAPGQIRQLQALVDEAAKALPGFLGRAVRVSDLFAAYSPHLGAILGNYANGLGVLAKAVRDGSLQITGILQRSTRCEYDIERRDPRNPVRRPLVDTGHCPSDFPNLQRGAAHAPGPVR